MNTDFPLKAQDAIIGDVIIYPEMDMSRTDKKSFESRCIFRVLFLLVACPRLSSSVDQQT